MASQLLIEGVLDTKGARGSEDRKFLKVWRRQWARFSVVYPSGRREPYLALTLSPNSSAISDKEIKLSRDGLRLFRCRSKSRPYRTWAVTSANKVVQYFAAESEIQAQNWMQAVRDGLWPPCFSFQMLTACSYEVSLIDDDNTFMAGHLGVYGRFVLTSEDIISLMHPHWGSTLLEISLDNVIDVLFIREAEISPAGVFSIILKRIDGSNVNALQFFCNTAKDAMQWILSKLYMRRKSFSSLGNRKLSENRVSFSISDQSANTETCIYRNTDNGKTITSINDHLVSSQASSKSKNINDPLFAINLEPEYENTRSLQMSTFESQDKRLPFNKQINGSETSSLEHTSETKFLEKSKKNYLHGFSLVSENVDRYDLANTISNENIYENILNEKTLDEEEHFKGFGITDNLKELSTKCADKKELDEKSYLIPKDPSVKPVTIEPVEYAVVDKSNLEKPGEFTVKHIFPTIGNTYDCHVHGSDTLEKSKIFHSPENYKNDSSFISTTSYNIVPPVTKIVQHKTEILNGSITVNYDSKFSESSNSNDHLYSTVNKNASNSSTKENDDATFLESSNSSDHLCSTINKNASNSTNSMQYSINESSSYFRNSTKENPVFLNLPSNVLDTSLNSLNSRNKGRGSSSSSEEDNENLLSLIKEFDELKVNEQVYEDLSERKGTIYEEIDESDEEYSNPSLNAPELPVRPTNLEIPESLRLQKLSRNIQTTLDVMGDKQSLKVLHRPKFIKKIKDVNRIMRLSPNHEHAKEPFKVESKLKINTEK